MKVKILIVGESCKDVFVYCNADRLCPDVPVPVLSVISQTENWGMAMNVYKNTKVLLQECEIATNHNWESITKTRYMHLDTNHMFIRIDSDHTKIPRCNVRSLNLEEYELVAVSDYNKGFLTEQDIEYICNNHDNVFVDTKKVLGQWAKNAKIIKINNYEYNKSKDVVGSDILTKIIHTKGAEGCVYKGESFPVSKVEVKDSSGAGDTFFAALICKYTERRDIKESIVFANECASEVVKHRGVTTIKK